jgi:hypothetical protein
LLDTLRLKMFMLTEEWKDDCLLLFLCPLSHPPNHTLIHSNTLIHSLALTHSLIYSLALLFKNSFSLTHSFSHLITPSLILSFIYSVTESLTISLNFCILFPSIIFSFFSLNFICFNISSFQFLKCFSLNN